MTMRDLRDVYPDLADGDFREQYEYDPMVESLGHEVLARARDDDYQGYTRYLLRDGHRLGVLIISWGSCSGCDALQACCSLDELERLRASIAGDVRWFDARDACLAWLRDTTAHGFQCWGDDGETARFIEEAAALIETMA